MTRPIVIGLLGRAGSGKTTAAGYLRDFYGAKVFSFARAVKMLCKHVWDFRDEQMYGTQAQKEAVDERYGMSPRTAMIRLGDGARNVLWDRIWVDVCFKLIEEEHKKSPAPFYVIEDVRYPNEAEAVSAHLTFYGHVLKLIYTGNKASADYMNAPSEKSVDECNAEDIFRVITHHETPDAIDLKEKLADSMAQISFGRPEAPRTDSERAGQ